MDQDEYQKRLAHAQSFGFASIEELEAWIERARTAMDEKCEHGRTAWQLCDICDTFDDGGGDDNG